MSFYVVNSKDSERICEVGNFAGHDDFDNEVYTGDIVGFFKLSDTDDGKMTPQVCGYAIIIGDDGSSNDIEFVVIEKNYNGKIEVLPKGIIKSYKDISYDGYKYLNSNYCINEIGRINKIDNNTLEIFYSEECIVNVYWGASDNEVCFTSDICHEPQCVSIVKDDIPEVIKFLQDLCDKENNNKISNKD